VAEAAEEAIEFIFLSQPVKILTANGAVKGVECVKNMLGPAGKDGRPQPRPIAGSNFTLAVDSVIAAIGEAPDFSFLPADVERTSAAVTVDMTGATSDKKIFAGGDLVVQPRTIAYALGSGKKAAMAIDARLQGKDAAKVLPAARWGGQGGLSMRRYREGNPDGVSPEVVKFKELNLAYFKRQKRQGPARLSPGERSAAFAEINRGLSPAEALQEAKRCFNCGVCNLCHNCFIYCPDLVISARPDKKGYDINYDYCKGCCICVEECPRGAISVEVKK
jgi:Pyruvate/2-oxoacid:ferredoxin oxidoreductase delta subunit